MRFGLSVMNFGDFADARVMADLAREAEAAGWEALLVWDHLAFMWGPPSGDPWTLVTACSLVTEHLLVGTDVSVIARERPLPFANRVATVDRLSDGRVVLGVGVGGAADEYRGAGEPVDLRERAAVTDEVLDVVRRLLAGERVTHRGAACTVEGVTLAPLPVQAPVPVWVGGNSAGARRRAARHDGWVPFPYDEEGNLQLPPAMFGEQLAGILAARAAAGIPAYAPFAAATHGETPVDPVEGAAAVRPWGEAGATWWLESLHGYRGTTADLFARVQAGPPRG
jgi:alkanesulfonate monooxygenase SsuD/methylene tetrahydromethanopterin reductase-like flavin-dependent oxidoreductase (luciferase family)